MTMPDVKRLRASFRTTLQMAPTEGWSKLDFVALATALLVSVYVQRLIYFDPGTLSERVLLFPLTFIAAATAVYAIWYLPLIFIQVIRRYWWIVLIAFALFLAWLRFRAPF